MLAKRPRPDLADRLDPLRDDFDRLCADARTRAPLSHYDYDRLEERAAEFLDAVRTVFRGEAR